MGFLKRQRQCGVSHEVLWGAQGASHMALGKSGLHAHCKGERVIALQSWAIKALCHPGHSDGHVSVILLVKPMRSTTKLSVEFWETETLFSWDLKLVE